jgi:WD40 repeat protein
MEGKVIRLAVASDGHTVAANSDGDDGVSIHLWDARGAVRLRLLKRHTSRVGRLAFSPDGSTLASAGWDDKLGLWDVADGGKGELLPGHYGRIYGLAFSPDGKTLATSGEDAIRLWNVASRQQMVVLPTETRTYDVAFSRDGRWLAAGLDGGTIRLWEAPSFAEIAAVENQSAGPR